MSWQESFQNFKNYSTLDSIKASEERQKAFENFMAAGLPTKKEEAWKFTSLSDFKSTEWKSHSDEETHLTHEQMQELSKKLPSEFTNFVFVNGVLNLTLSDDTDSLIEVQELQADDIIFDNQHIEQRLLNLSQAFLNKKVLISVSKFKTLEKPVQILFVQASKNPVYSSESFVVRLEENSEAKIILNSVSFAQSSADAINLNVKVELQKNARLNLIQLQNEDLQSYHFSQVSIELASSASLTTLAMSLGNKLIRNFYSLKFTGENAQANVYGLSVLDADQHVDNYTFIQHLIGHNQSVQHYKSILSGSAHSVFRGRVLIAPNAQKANSEQLNNNLLLTRTAQVETIPQLEIFADDVKAGHGATVGQLNKDEIFYFLSRGIDQYQAVKMLSYGFAKELVYKIENEAVQNYLIAALNQKLEKMVQHA